MQPMTPGVYITERNAFPNSVVEVATAIPAFIGYTEQALKGSTPLTGLPTRIESLKQFEDYFGGPALQTFELTAAQPATTGLSAGKGGKPKAGSGSGATDSEADSSSPATFRIYLSGGQEIPLSPTDNRQFYLYNAVKLFYYNGGSTCFITSLGTYAEGDTPSVDKFSNALVPLTYEQDPTMVLCPDALRLKQNDYYSVTQQMLAHCAQMQSRVALFDVYDGAVTAPGDVDNVIALFRSGVKNNNLKYGVAYFPWVETTLVSEAQVSFTMLSPTALDALRATVLSEPTGSADKDKDALHGPHPHKNQEVSVKEGEGHEAASSGTTPKQSQTPTPQEQLIINLGTQFDSAKKLLATPAATGKDAKAQVEYAAVLATLTEQRRAVHNSLLALSADYRLVMQAVARYANILPVAPAMAGVYTATDSSRGVWKAPANVSLNAVVAPTVALSDEKQNNLNIDALTGKSVNAIRAFRGMGTLVWGARTLDGNSQDWRYVNVRRTMIMLEQSVKLAARSYVFEPNDANTWTTVKSMINSFLFNLWKQGALAGTKPEDAYSVQVGLGSTMTADDILKGLMNVTVLVALVRPAEFIMLTFQQQMQKS